MIWPLWTVGALISIADALICIRLGHQDWGVLAFCAAYCAAKVHP